MYGVSTGVSESCNAWKWTLMFVGGWGFPYVMKVFMQFDRFIAMYILI